MPKKLSRPQEDLLLIRKAQRGDEDALASIFKEHQSNLRGVAFKILKNEDDVDDALQIVRIKVWEKIGIFDPSKGAKLSTWLYKITKNVCIDMLSSRDDGGKLYMDDEWAEGKVDPSDGVVATVADHLYFNGWLEGEAYDDDYDNSVFDYYGPPNGDGNGNRRFHDPTVKLTPMQKARNKRARRNMKWYEERDRGSRGGPHAKISPAERAWLGGNERCPPKLSRREERIRKSLMDGKTRKEIIKKEGIAASALDTAICRINNKFLVKV